MDEDDLIRELSLLLHKVTASEDLVQQAEAYFEVRKHDWSRALCGYFLDTLERKRDQIDYEWLRIQRMGQAIASGRAGHWNDAMDL